MPAAEARFMAEALRLARRGRYTAKPNPCVGCVIVAGDEVVGRGWHKRAGEAHAEILALDEAGDRARGATAYVTLEPCSHTGRTGPCTEALIRAGISRVVVAVSDPNPAVNGKGLAALRKAGVDVVEGPGGAESEALNRGFFHRHRTSRPWISLKIAASIDGRTALSDGQSQWITAEPARRDVQRLRAESGAVLCGAGTLLQDNPRLTARTAGAVQPLRVIVDGRLRTSPDLRLFEEPGEVLIFTAQTEKHPNWRALSGLPQVRLKTLPKAQVGVDLPAAFAHLAELEINQVLVEGGARLAGSLLREGFADELIVYLAPTLLGPDARALAELPPLESLRERPDFEFAELRRIGPDCRVRLVPRHV